MKQIKIPPLEIVIDNSPPIIESYEERQKRIARAAYASVIAYYPELFQAIIRRSVRLFDPDIHNDNDWTKWKLLNIIESTSQLDLISDTACEETGITISNMSAAMIRSFDNDTGIMRCYGGTDCHVLPFSDKKELTKYIEVLAL